MKEHYVVTVERRTGRTLLWEGPMPEKAANAEANSRVAADWRGPSPTYARVATRWLGEQERA